MNVRQKKVIKKLVENGGKSAKQAMLESGYSQAYASNPQKLFRSKNLQEELSSFDYKPLKQTLVKMTKKKYLASVEVLHNLKDADIKALFKKMGHTDIKIIDAKIKKIVYYIDDSSAVILRAADMIMKVNGDYAPEKIDLTPTRVRGLSDKELIQLAESKSKELQKKINAVSTKSTK